MQIDDQAGAPKEGPIFSKIPKIIHQTWKDKNVPSAYLVFQKSWQTHLPDWEYRLWTDTENRDFLATHYDWFLPIYDAYPKAIMRADAIRYFWMYHYGGLYVDLDFEALKSVEPLFEGQKIVIGLEPESHAQKELVQQKGLTYILCNAFLASIPKAGFWKFMISQLVKDQKQLDPLDATGPFCLTRGYQSFEDKASITLIPAALLYPIDENVGYDNLTKKLTSEVPVNTEAYGIHHWAGSWWRDALTNLLKERFRLLIYNSAAELPSAPHPVAKGCWYRILEKGANIHQGAIDLQKESETLLVQPEHLPMVSCLMVTRNRFQMATQAIERFLAQSYPNRELIIIDDGNDTRLKEWVEALTQPSIRFFNLPDEGQKLGVLRNLSRQYAEGKFIAQWDDDDLSHPNRLLFQMTLIQQFELDGCTLQREQLWFPAKRQQGYSGRRLWEGAMVCNHQKLPLYHERRRGEESDAITFLALKGKIALLDFPSLYTYCFHGDNTFDELHFEQLWKAASFQFESPNLNTKP